MNRCPNCKSDRFEAVAEEHTVHVGGAEVSGTVDVTRCLECTESFTDAEELRRFDAAAAASLIAVGFHRGSVLRFARKALGMRSIDFARFIGVKPETVSRWEAETQEPPRSVFLLLHVLLRESAAGGIRQREAVEAVEPSANAGSPPRLRVDRAA
jgi:putative zinc finger/helix-turn-helix YgiT family protein